ncbi:hypothetical protein BH10PSE8_BH10PSE8_01030 [soil metagenome]
MKAFSFSLMAVAAMSAIGLGSGGAAGANIRIISRAHEGFRRGGIAHPADATYPIGIFTEKQLERIRDEPLLTTMVIASDAEAEASLSLRTPLAAPAPSGIVEPPLPAGVAAAPGQPSPMTPQERLKAILGLVPGLGASSFGEDGVVTPAERWAMATSLGFLPSEDEFSAVAEAWRANAPKPVLSAIERETAILGLVPGFAVGDFTNAGTFRAEARRRLAAQLGFEPSDDEIRAAGEAYTRQLADKTD